MTVNTAVIYEVIISYILLASLASVLLAPFRKWSSTANLAPFVIPAIISVAGLIGSWLKGKAANKSVEEQQNLYNAYLAARAAGVQDIIGHLSAEGTNVFGPQVSTSQQSGTSSSSTTSQSSQTPTITPQYAGLEETLRNLAASRLAKEQAPIAGEAEQRARIINDTFAGATRNAEATNAARGIKSLSTDINSRRAGAIASVLPDLTKEARDRQTQDIGLASALTQAFGLGHNQSGTSNTYGSSNSMGTYTTPPNLSALLALLLPPGPNAGTQTGMSPVGQGIGDAAAIFGGLYHPPATLPASGAGPSGASCIDPKTGYWMCS